MNKRKAKALKKLSQELPESFTIRAHSESVLGIDLIKEEQREGMEIELEQYYGVRKAVVFPINHYKKLKKAFIKDGTQGIIDYIVWLKAHNAKMNELLAEVDKIADIDSGILAVVGMGAKRFWFNLMNFMYAFFMNFRSHKV